MGSARLGRPDYYLNCDSTRNHTARQRINSVPGHSGLTPHGHAHPRRRAASRPMAKARAQGGKGKAKPPGKDSGGGKPRERVNAATVELAEPMANAVGRPMRPWPV